MASKARPVKAACSRCGLRSTRGSSGVCELCLKFPEVAAVVADRVLVLSERYGESLSVLRMCGIDVDDLDDSLDDSDVLDERLDVIDDLMAVGGIYDASRPDRFRGAAAVRAGRLPAVLAGGDGPAAAGVCDLSGGGRAAAGGGVGGVPEDQSGRPAGRGRGVRGRRPAGAAPLGIFAAAVGRWLPRAKFAPWQRVVLPAALGGEEGEVMSVRVSGGARVYRVRVGFAGVTEAPEYVLQEAAT